MLCGNRRLGFVDVELRCFFFLIACVLIKPPGACTVYLSTTIIADKIVGWAHRNDWPIWCHPRVPNSLLLLKGPQSEAVAEYVFCKRLSIKKMPRAPRNPVACGD